MADYQLATPSPVGLTAVDGDRSLHLPQLRMLRRIATWQSAVVATFAGLLAFGDAHHAYWADEVQAWLIAKDSSVWNMFAHVLRYEGNPGLWHLLLWVPAHLGAPMATLSVITAIAALAGVVLLVYRSPFPAWARALLPFAYFVCFQGGVVARPYCLLPLATCAIALTWPDRMTRPHRLVAALVLMSFVAADGFLVSAALGAIQVLDLRRAWSALSVRARRRHVGALFVFACAMALVVAILLPPPDASFNMSNPVTPASATGLVVQMTTGAIAGVWLTGPVLMVSMVFLRRRGQLRLFAVPVVLVLAFMVWKIGEPWQQGFIFFPWLLAMWMAWDAAPATRSISDGRWSREARIALACVIAVQAYWSVAAFATSTRVSYSALPAATAYLEAQGLSRGVVYGYFFHAFLVNGFAGRNIFANMNGGRPPDFYPWTTEELSRESAASTVNAGVPDVVVITVQHYVGLDNNRIVPLPGYVRVGYFEGSIIWKDGIYEQDNILIARRADFRPHTAFGGTCPINCGPPTAS